MPAVVSSTVGSLCGIRLEDGCRWLALSCQNLMKAARISSLERGGMGTFPQDASACSGEHGKLALAGHGARPAQIRAAVVRRLDRHVREPAATQDTCDGLQRVLGRVVVL